VRDRLIETITAEVELGGDVHDVMLRVLEAIRSTAGATAGHLYWRDLVSVQPVLVSSSLWCSAAGVGLALFQAASDGFRFHPGEGLPGRAMAVRAAIWFSDVATDERFLRAPFAAASGLHAAFAFPAIAKGEVVAVLEFFFDRVLEPDEELLGILDEISAILGPVINTGRAP